MENKVLLLNAGHSEEPLIDELHNLGYYVITTGKRAEFPGHKKADEYISEDYSNKDAILKLCIRENVSGIVSCAHDYGFVTAAYVGEKMGWKGHDTYDNTLLLHQKDSFRKFCLDNDIRVPKSEEFSNEIEAIDYLDSISYPVMIKSTFQASGVGVLRVENKEEALDAIRNSFDKSGKKKILIEEYIQGKQESVNAFVIDGKVKVAVTCDCYSPINPYLIQTETLLSENYEALKDELYEMIEKIFSKLHLVDGIITIQYIVRDGKPYVLEMMRRCLGNRYLLAAEAVSGFPWHKALVMSELGEDCSNLEPGKPVGKFAGHHAIMSTKNGVYQGYEVPDEIMQHVFASYELMKKGDVISNYKQERMGYIYYTYDNREELDYAAKHFNDMIKLTVV